MRRKLPPWIDRLVCPMGALEEIEVLIREQRRMPKYKKGLEGEDEHVVHDRLLYTLEPPMAKDVFPPVSAASTRMLPDNNKSPPGSRSPGYG